MKLALRAFRSHFPHGKSKAFANNNLRGQFKNFSMRSKILSLNVSIPEVHHWKDKSKNTSMNKKSVDRLIVSKDHIQGDVFGEPEFHGHEYSVVYIIGKTMGDLYFKQLGLQSTYRTGSVGENILVDEFDESQIYLGDIFKIGEVEVEAAFIRKPCQTLNVTFQNPAAMKSMIDIFRSGVYFRVKKAGVITVQDEVVRIFESVNSISMQDLYLLFTSQKTPTSEHLQVLKNNLAIPEKFLSKFEVMLAAQS
jgi:MOSC domain-containing protein YiiM